MEISKMSSEEHTALWDRFRAGNQEAFSSIYELFAPDLYRYGYNLIRDKPLIEDALQDLFLNLYNQKSRLGPTTNIRFYLYRAFRNRLIDLIQNSRKYNREVELENNQSFVLETGEYEWMEEEFVDWQKALMMKELNNLPKRQREILYLVYIQGMSYEETAKIMEITPKTVLNGVKVALSTLQKYVLPVFKRNGVMAFLLFSLVKAATWNQLQLFI